MSTNKTCYDKAEKILPDHDGIVLSKIRQSRNTLLKEAVKAFEGMLDYKSQGVCAALSMTWIAYALDHRQDAFIAAIEDDMTPILECQLKYEKAKLEMMERHQVLVRNDDLDRAIKAVNDHLQPIMTRFAAKGGGPSLGEINEHNRLKAVAEQCRVMRLQQSEDIVREAESFVARQILGKEDARRGVDFTLKEAHSWDTLLARLAKLCGKDKQRFIYLSMQDRGRGSVHSHAIAFYLGGTGSKAWFIDANACLYEFPRSNALLGFLVAYLPAAYQLDFDTFTLLQIPAR